MNKTTRSYIIYFGILIVCFLLADQAEKRNNKKYVFWIAVILSFFMGFRKKTVGIDSKAYYNMFRWTYNNIAVANSYNDPYFYRITRLIMKIKNDPYFVFLVIAIVTNFLSVYRLWDYRKLTSFKYSVLRYYTLFYAYQSNCMRQFLAMAIVFYGTRYLEKKDYTRFLVFVGIASICHLAALTSIGYIALEKIKWKDLDKRSKNFVNVSYLLSPIIVALVLYVSNSRAEQYFNSTSQLTSGYLSYALKIILFFAYIYINFNNNIEEALEIPNIRMIFVYYSVGMILTGFGFRYAQFERIGYFYYIYAGTYVGFVANEKYYRTVHRMIILFIVIRSFYNLCGNNAMGQMPYLFNWE